MGVGFHPPEIDLQAAGGGAHFWEVEVHAGHTAANERLFFYQSYVGPSFCSFDRSGQAADPAADDEDLSPSAVSAH